MNDVLSGLVAQGYEKSETESIIRVHLSGNSYLYEYKDRNAVLHVLETGNGKIARNGHFVCGIAKLPDGTHIVIYSDNSVGFLNDDDDSYSHLRDGIRLDDSIICVGLLDAKKPILLMLNIKSGRVCFDIKEILGVLMDTIEARGLEVRGVYDILAMWAYYNKDDTLMQLLAGMFTEGDDTDMEDNP